MTVFFPTLSFLQTSPLNWRRSTSSPKQCRIYLFLKSSFQSAELLISHVNLYAYGCDIIREDNASLTPYGLLHRADYQPMLTPVQKASEANMTMR